MSYEERTVLALERIADALDEIKPKMPVGTKVPCNHTWEPIDGRKYHTGSSIMLRCGKCGAARVGEPGEVIDIS